MFRPSLGLFESSWRFWEPKCENAQFWPLTWPWPDTWPFKKNFKSGLEPSRRDLSNAASPVSLRSLVWELVWGGWELVWGRYTPPPPGQWRSAETPVKRGLRLIWGLDHRSRSQSRGSRYILHGAGAGAAKQFYSEPEPELEPTKKCHGSASLIICINNVDVGRFPVVFWCPVQP